MSEVREIALLARAPTTSISEAEDLIQQFANVVAGEAVLKALHEAHAKTMAVLNAPLHVEKA